MKTAVVLLSLASFVFVHGQNVSMSNFTGPSNLVAKSFEPVCPSGARAGQYLIMDTIFQPMGPGIDVSGVGRAISSQAGACGYSGTDSAGGRPWMYEQAFGVHPAVYGTAENGYITTNGGVPQNLTGGLDAHVEALTLAVNQAIPIDYNGSLLLDYEGWQPVWDDFLGGGYKNVSMKLVMDTHPEWPMSKVEAVAQSDFESAGRAYYLKTISTLKGLRPNMRVGFYATPAKLWHDYWDPEYSAAQQAHNNNLTWLWEAVDLMSAELYLHGPPVHSDPYAPTNTSWVRMILWENERIVNMVKTQSGKQLSTIPFSWVRTGAAEGFLYGDDLAADFEVPFEFPSVEAVLVWGNPAVGNTPWADMVKYYNGTFIPWAKSMLNKRCQMQLQKCSDHGRSVNNDTACVCFEGYTGPSCATKLDSSSPSPPQKSPKTSSGVLCPDGITACPSNTTCAQLSTAMWSCCPLPNANICGSDYSFCCPQGYNCDVPNQVCYSKN